MWIYMSMVSMRMSSVAYLWLVLLRQVPSRFRSLTRAVRSSIMKFWFRLLLVIFCCNVMGRLVFAWLNFGMFGSAFISVHVWIMILCVGWQLDLDSTDSLMLHGFCRFSFCSGGLVWFMAVRISEWVVPWLYGSVLKESRYRDDHFF